jgi:site-specific recombinase XerD
MKTETWSQRMNMYSKQIGFKVQPYDLRHSFTLNFLRNGGNVFVLQRLMGHCTLDMTKRYLALTQEDIQKQHAKASPVNMLECGMSGRLGRVGGR